MKPVLRILLQIDDTPRNREIAASAFAAMQQALQTSAIPGDVAKLERVEILEAQVSKKPSPMQN
jgi:hypothetical protein